MPASGDAAACGLAPRLTAVCQQLQASGLLALLVPLDPLPAPEETLRLVRPVSCIRAIAQAAFCAVRPPGHHPEP